MKLKLTLLMLFFPALLLAQTEQNCDVDDNAAPKSQITDSPCVEAQPQPTTCEIEDSPYVEAEPTAKELYKINIMFPFEIKSWEITSGFGWRHLNGKKEFHKGVDVGAYLGTKILAAHSGHVFKFGEDNDAGKYIAIESEDGNYRTYYLHLGGRPREFLKLGSNIKQGDIIGWVGATGYSTGVHLHFELRYKEEDGTEFKSINPMPFLTDYELKQIASK